MISPGYQQDGKRCEIEGKRAMTANCCYSDALYSCTPNNHVKTVVSLYNPTRSFWHNLDTIFVE